MPVVDSLEREIQGLRALLHTDRDPQGRAFVPLADAYRRARNLERALEVVTIGLERHPQLASAHVVEAWVQQDRGDPNGAAGLGNLLAAAGRTSRAGPLLERARALEPTQRELAESRAPEVPTAPAAPVPETPAVLVAAESESAPELDEQEREEPAHELPNTRTLAELYAKQGLHGRAAEVYERLARERPDDLGLRKRLAELRAEGSGASAAAAPAGVHDEDTETLARELGSAVAPVGPSVTPFAWASDEPGEAIAENGQTVASYFRTLLGWSRADRAGSPAAGRAAAPDAGASTEGVAPRPAPAEIPIRHIVPIESLAPAIVPIELLAPGKVVPVHALAPVAIPIEMLAPHEGQAFRAPS
jgi:tetratricopeptide (TPR) repeat protein